MSCRTGVAECSIFLGDSPHCTGLPTGRGFRPVRRHPPPRRSFGRVLFFGVPIRYPRFQKKGEQFTTARCLCFSQQPAWRQSAEISQIHHCCAPSPSACQKQTDPARLRRTRSKLETLSMLPTKDIQIDPVPVCQLGTFPPWPYNFGPRLPSVGTTSERRYPTTRQRNQGCRISTNGQRMYVKPTARGRRRSGFGSNNPRWNQLRVREDAALEKWKGNAHVVAGVRDVVGGLRRVGHFSSFARKLYPADVNRAQQKH